MKILGLIIFSLILIADIKAVAQSVALKNELNTESSEISWSSTSVTTKDDSVLIKIHRLPSSSKFLRLKKENLKKLKKVVQLNG